MRNGAIINSMDLFRRVTCNLIFGWISLKKMISIISDDLFVSSLGTSMNVQVDAFRCVCGPVSRDERLRAFVCAIVTRPRERREPSRVETMSFFRSFCLCNSHIPASERAGCRSIKGGAPIVLH